jgi:hypothetical protein
MHLVEDGRQALPIYWVDQLLRGAQCAGHLLRSRIETTITGIVASSGSAFNAARAAQPSTWFPLRCVVVDHQDCVGTPLSQRLNVVLRRCGPSLLGASWQPYGEGRAAPILTLDSQTGAWHLAETATQGQAVDIADLAVAGANTFRQTTSFE